MRLSHTHGVAELFQGLVNTERLSRALAVVRKHLQMDVAFISHFHADDRTLTHVDGDASCPLRQGEVIPLNEGYCLKVVRGELPECIPDTSQVPTTQEIPATHVIPIGSHMSVPIRLEDGTVYGTLCCFSYKPNLSLGERDMQMLRGFAEILALRFSELAAAEQARRSAADLILAVIARDAVRVVFQSVWDIPTQSVHGFECLSRFDAEPRRPPDQWFEAAAGAGVGLDLELHTIDKALRALKDFPVGMTLNINSSPDLILSGRLQQLLAQGHDLSRLILEVTEHAAIPDYKAMSDALAPLRAQGVRLAVDDAGAGYSSMRHILNLCPDVIKLDMSLTRDIDTDPKRRALAKGLTSFAHEIGAKVVAEGVETAAELQTLAHLGVDSAQGYYLAKPLALDEAMARCS